MNCSLPSAPCVRNIRASASTPVAVSLRWSSWRLRSRGEGLRSFWRGKLNPADIPTIKSNGAYRQKPADPGGIDIPNQDVRVYEQLEGKNGASYVEHLLPPPETPKESRPAPPPAAIPDAVATAAPTPLAAPVAVVTPSLQPHALQQADVLKNASGAKPVSTTADKAPEPPKAPVVVNKPPVALKPSAKKEVVSFDDVIARINKKEPLTAVSVPAGKAVFQLASLPDEKQARDMMGKLRQKYGSQLGKASLHVLRAVGGTGRLLSNSKRAARKGRCNSHMFVSEEA